MRDNWYENFYSAFGLTINSELKLQELPKLQKKTKKIDVYINYGSLVKEKSMSSEPNKIISIIKDIVIFQVPEFAIFFMRNGNEIKVFPLRDYEERKAKLYILGTCLGALLFQRKTLPLHGSAVAINGKAYAIIGDSGAGKSTLASALINRGYPILTDDVIALKKTNDNNPLVMPAYPQQKLWENSLKEFNMDSVKLTPLFERDTKFAVPVRENFFNNPLPLAGVFELVMWEGAAVNLDSINPLERLHVLFQHTYRNLFIKRLGLREWHLQYTASFAKNIQMYRLTRPTSRFTANELATLIEETVLKEELVHD